jgi:DNA modification methylase
MIHTGDAMELIPTLEDGSVPLVVTSPPYPGQWGNGMDSAEWLNWYDEWMNLLYSALAPNGVAVINVQFKREASGYFDRHVLEVAYPFHAVHAGGLGPWHMLDIYIYGKSNPPPNGALTYCDPPGWEFIYVLTKANRPEDVTFNPVRAPYARRSIRASDGRVHVGTASGIAGGRNENAMPHPDGARQTTLMKLSMSGDQNRPRANGRSFPRGLPERFIRQYTNPGDLVLDPFCGVGTTPYVAAQLGRRYVGFEIDPQEAERAREWLRELEANQ